MKYSIIITKRIEFILIDSPNDTNIEEFNEILHNYPVNYIVRITNDKYKLDEKNSNIIIKDLYFEDGEFPPEHILDEFEEFLTECKKKYKYPVVAIHCKSSYGRAPCLIASEMMHTGMFSNKYQVVEYIRDRRPGCFNTKQLHWVLTYTRANKPNKCCIIM